MSRPLSASTVPEASPRSRNLFAILRREIFWRLSAARDALRGHGHREAVHDSRTERASGHRHRERRHGDVERNVQRRDQRSRRSYSRLGQRGTDGRTAP